MSLFETFQKYVAEDNDVYLSSATQLDLMEDILENRGEFIIGLRTLSYEELYRIAEKLDDFVGAMEEEGIHFWDELGEEEVTDFEKHLDEVREIVYDIRDEKEPNEANGNQTGGRRHRKKKQTRRRHNLKKKRTHRRNLKKKQTRRQRKSRRAAK